MSLLLADATNLKQWSDRRDACVSVRPSAGDHAG